MRATKVKIINNRAYFYALDHFNCEKTNQKRRDKKQSGEISRTDGMGGIYDTEISLGPVGSQKLMNNLAFYNINVTIQEIEKRVITGWMRKGFNEEEATLKLRKQLEQYHIKEEHEKQQIKWGA